MLWFKWYINQSFSTNFYESQSVSNLTLCSNLFKADFFNKEKIGSINSSFARRNSMDDIVDISYFYGIYWFYSISFIEIIILIFKILAVMEISYCDVLTSGTFFPLLTDCYPFSLLLFFFFINIKLKYFFFIRVFINIFYWYCDILGCLGNFFFNDSVGGHWENVLIVTWRFGFLLIWVTFFKSSGRISVSGGMGFTIDFLKKFVFNVLIDILCLIFGH